MFLREGTGGESPHLQQMMVSHRPQARVSALRPGDGYLRKSLPCSSKVSDQKVDKDMGTCALFVFTAAGSGG